jgi:hypothetical protein
MGRRGRVEDVEVVEDEDGLGRELLKGAPHRGGQDVVAGARGQDVERALTDARRDPPQAQHDARGEEVGIRVALVEGELATGRPPRRGGPPAGTSVYPASAADTSRARCRPAAPGPGADRRRAVSATAASADRENGSVIAVVSAGEAPESTGHGDLGALW